MQGIVDAMLLLSPGVSPKYFEPSHRSATALGDEFETRLRDLIPLLGEPVVESRPAWSPSVDQVAGWRRDDKTLFLILERDQRPGAAVLLWCLSDGELATLLDLSRTRAERVTAADFDQELGRQMARFDELGRHKFLIFRRLMDDLAAIPDRSDMLLADKLADSDGQVRCVAADLVLKLGGGLPAVLPLLDDPEDWVRWHVVGLLARYGDDSAVEPLIGKLGSDSDLDVRVQAAYALGHIGSPAAIPHLLDALDHAHECDSQGHSPSDVSATALDDILGTNQTRIKHDNGYCSMAPWPPDYDALRSQASELYERWKEGR